MAVPDDNVCGKLLNRGGGGEYDTAAYTASSCPPGTAQTVTEIYNGLGPRWVVVSSGNVSLLASTAFAFAEDKVLEFRPGAVLQIPPNTVFEIYARIVAGRWPIFNVPATSRVVLGNQSTDVIYPEWWGAKADGDNYNAPFNAAALAAATRNSAALNAAAVAAVPAKAGISLADGTYLVDQPVIAQPGNRIIGQGAGLTTLKPAVAGLPEVLQIGAGVNGVVVQGVTVDCSAVTGIGSGIFADRADGLVVEGCVVKGAAGTNMDLVRLKACTRSRVEDLEVFVGRRGIVLLGKSEHVMVTRCRVHDVYDYGIYVAWDPDMVPPTASNHVTVADCDVWNVVMGSEVIKGCPRHPIYFVCSNNNQVVRHRNARVINNRVTGNNTSWIPSCKEAPPATWGTGTADNIGIYQCLDAVVAENVSTHGGDLGIALDYAEGCTVVANVCAFNDTEGIGVWNSKNCVIASNVCYNNGQWRNTDPKPTMGGIGLTKSNENTIVGNRCYDNQATKTQSYGIVADVQSTGNVIVGNQLQGNVTAPYKLDGVQSLGVESVNGQITTESLVAQTVTTQSIGFAGTSGGPDVSLGRIAPYVLRATGYLAVGDQATGVGGTLNVRANSKDTEGVNVRGVTDQAADLLRVQAHNGSDALRVGAGSIGFLGKPPIGVQTVSVTGATTEEKLDRLLLALQNLGLIDVVPSL